jgi:2,4-dienoyl-CoA reductase-like NADH-dependent reductase (Old Yellow Enzyme family)
MSPYTNKRTDVYGGNLLNRSRLTKEIVEEIKSEFDGDFLVWVRMNACEALYPGLTLEDGQQIAAILAKAGADVIHVSAYTLPINKEITGKFTLRVGALPHKSTPRGPFLEYAAAIKRAVGVPVIAVGKLDDPELASNALLEEKCDLIALGRQLICDPNWVLKVVKDQQSEIVHCNYCMTCHTAQQRGVEVRCAQNLNLYGAPVYAGNSADR